MSIWYKLRSNLHSEQTSVFLKTKLLRVFAPFVSTFVIRLVSWNVWLLSMELCLCKSILDRFLHKNICAFSHEVCVVAWILVEPFTFSSFFYLLINRKQNPADTTNNSNKLKDKLISIIYLQYFHLTYYLHTQLMLILDNTLLTTLFITLAQIQKITSALLGLLLKN